MSKKVIAVDVDDVLAVGAQGFIDFSNQKWGTKLTIEEYDERWARMWGVDHAEEIRRANIVYAERVIRSFKALEEARDVLMNLKQSYRLVIATSRVRKIQADTEEWITDNFGDIFEEVHFAGFYDDLKPGSHKHTKAELLQSIGADYIVDDHPKHCVAAAKAGVRAILFGEYPWNRDTELLPNMARALDWHEVERYFDGRSR